MLVKYIYETLIDDVRVYGIAEVNTNSFQMVRLRNQQENCTTCIIAIVFCEF